LGCIFDRSIDSCSVFLVTAYLCSLESLDGLGLLHVGFQDTITTPFWSKEKLPSFDLREQLSFTLCPALRTHWTVKLDASR
jgi:hypothetical protein